jgi:hypothetical protein
MTNCDAETFGALEFFLRDESYSVHLGERLAV